MRRHKIPQLVALFIVGLLFGVGVVRISARKDNAGTKSTVLRTSVSGALGTGVHSTFEADFLEILRRVKNGGAVDLPIRLQETVAAWLRADPIGCLNSLAVHGALALVPDSSVKAVATRLSTVDFTEAIRLARDLQSTRIQDIFVTTAFATAAKLRPRDALGLLDAVPRHLHGKISRELAEKWIENEPEAALLALSAETRISNAALYSALTNWAKTDGQKAFELILSSPEAQLRNRKQEIATLLLSTIGATAPATAFALLNGLPDSLHRELAPSVLERLSYGDPSIMQREVNRYPSGLLPQQAIVKGAKLAGLHDLDQASRVINTLPGIVGRQNAFNILAGTKASGEPEAAAEWVSRQTDPLTRSAAMSGTVGVWLQRAPTAAVNYAVEQMEKSSSPEWLNAVASELYQYSDRYSIPILVSQLNPAAKVALRQRVALTAGASPEFVALFN